MVRQYYVKNYVKHLGSNPIPSVLNFVFRKQTYSQLHNLTTLQTNQEKKLIVRC